MAQPRSALCDLLKPGQTPRAGGGVVDLVIQEYPNVTQLQVIARKDQSAALARQISNLLGARKTLVPLEGADKEGIHIYATGPLEYWVFSTKHSAFELEKRLEDKLGDTASLFDQTHGRFVVRISGDDATRLLAKGTSLDLDESAFPIQGASHSMIEHIPVLVVRNTSPACYDLSVPRSYAGSLLAWFSEAAAEFGYSVETPVN